MTSAPTRTRTTTAQRPARAHEHRHPWRDRRVRGSGRVRRSSAMRSPPRSRPARPSASPCARRGGGGVVVDVEPDATLNLTCANNFLGNQAQSVSRRRPGRAPATTPAPRSALPDLTERTPWNTSVTPGAGAGHGLPARGRVGAARQRDRDGRARDRPRRDPRLVDAGDPDCIAQADRGAYERQGLATPSASCRGRPAVAGRARVPADPREGARDLGRRPQPRSPRRKGAARAVLSFSLNKAARVTLTLRRADKGREVGKRCRKPSRRNRARKRCTRLVKVGRRVVLNGVARRNRVALRRLMARSA